MFRRAKGAEGRAVMRLFHSAQDQAADANLWLFRVDLARVENPIGIEIAKLVAQLITAFWDRTHAAPFAIAHFEDLVDQILSYLVAVATNDPRILVLHFSPP